MSPVSGPGLGTRHSPGRGNRVPSVSSSWWRCYGQAPLTGPGWVPGKGSGARVRRREGRIRRPWPPIPVLRCRVRSTPGRCCAGGLGRRAARRGLLRAASARVGDFAALLTATVLAGLRIVWAAVRERELNPFATVTLVVLGLGFVLAAVSGDARFLLLKNSIVTGAVGVVFPATTVVRRPLTLAAAQSFQPWSPSRAFPSAMAVIRGCITCTGCAPRVWGGLVAGGARACAADLPAADRCRGRGVRGDDHRRVCRADRVDSALHPPYHPRGIAGSNPRRQVGAYKAQTSPSGTVPGRCHPA